MFDVDDYAEELYKQSGCISKTWNITSDQHVKCSKCTV